MGLWQAPMVARCLLLLLSVGVAAVAAVAGSDCDGDIECLKRTYALLQAQHEAETYKNQNLTQQTEKLSTSIDKLRSDLKTKEETHAQLTAEFEKQKQAADILQASLEESKKVGARKRAAAAEAAKKVAELANKAEELKREADIRKQETEEALSRLTLVKDELKIRGKEAD